MIAARTVNMQRTDTLKRGPRRLNLADGVSLQGAADLLSSWQICHKLEARRGNEFPDVADLPQREPSKARDKGEVQIQTSPTLEGAADLLNLL